MTPEEQRQRQRSALQLEEIRAMMQVIDQEDPDASFDAIVDLAIKVPWLLELVNDLLARRALLQERIRELEENNDSLRDTIKDMGKRA